MNNKIKHLSNGDFEVIYQEKQTELTLGNLFRDEYPELYMNYKMMKQ